MDTTSLMAPTFRDTTDKHLTVPTMTTGVLHNKEIHILLKMALELKIILLRQIIMVLAKLSILGHKEVSIISTVMGIKHMFLKEEAGNK